MLGILLCKWFIMYICLVLISPGSISLKALMSGSDMNLTILKLQTSIHGVGSARYRLDTLLWVYTGLFSDAGWLQAYPDHEAPVQTVEIQVRATSRLPHPISRSFSM